MPLRTRLTERLGIKHPIISAPMGLLAGGKLVAAVRMRGDHAILRIARSVRRANQTIRSANDLSGAVDGICAGGR